MADIQKDPQLINVYDYAEAAKLHLPQMMYDFIAGGAVDEITLRENQRAFDRIKLQYRVLRGVGPRDLSTTILGHTLSLPILLAPTGSQKLVHPEGEIGVRKAADTVETLMMLGTTATTSMGEVVAAGSSPIWFQLFWLKDFEFTMEIVARAEATGFEAIVLTVDAPVFGVRERDIRNQFELPPGLTYENLPEDQSEQIVSSNVAEFMNRYWKTSVSWQEVDKLCANTSLPVLIKGVCHPDDARLAIEHGASGVIVSNHGGRQLDSAPATIEVLPQIVAAVQNKLPVLLDGGIRRGSDVLKAIALGAKAVAIGRPMLWGLAVNGQAGVEHVLQILRRELDIAMALCGCTTIADISPDLIFDPNKTV
ncbi:MAG: alpha-hydroxy acid oxidase [Chloroflexota bacterium]